VIGEDDRVPVNNTTAQPWNGICQLTIRSRTGKTYFGTGWLIGPRTVITAGHCVYLHGAGGWASKVEVSAGRNLASKPYGTIVSSRFSSVNGWVKNKSRDHDYGVIFLPQPFRPVGSGAAPFQFEFAALSDANLKGRVMNLSGYPADAPANGKNGLKQWFHARQASQVTARTIVYDIDTGGGQSGSPVWTLQSGRRTAVGIHTNGFHLGNSATRITAAVAANLDRWKQQAAPQLRAAAE
jgi:glutamyl endopeptidase